MASAAHNPVPKPPNPIDRQSTTPFHLKLFYRLHAFHHLSDFPISSAPSAVPLPAHLQIYTWQSCTLRELSQLLTSALPSLLPDPPVGTRLCFRLIYPDTRSAATLGPDARGRYLSKDMGSVVVGSSSYEREGAGKRRVSSSLDNNKNSNDNLVAASTAYGDRSLRLQGDDADRTLQDVRFVIGDYVDCAILPPLEDGSVAPPIFVGRGSQGGASVLGGGMRAFRENGFGSVNAGGGKFGRGGGRGGGANAVGGGIPSGDWRRGERLPEGSGRQPGRRSRGPHW